MKTVQYILLILCLCWTSTALAETQLELPEGLKVVAVNGHNADIVDHIKLADGLNQIVVQYTGELGHSFDTERVSSEVFVVIFTARSRSLSLSIPEITSHYDLDVFNSQPDIRIFTKRGDPLALRVDTLKKEGFQIFRDYAQELEIYNQTDAQAANPAFITFEQIDPAADLKRSKVSPADNHSDIALQILHYWYRQADTNTREQFKQSIKSH